MRKKFIKVLTLTTCLLGIFFPAARIYGQSTSIVNQEQAKTHLRWNIFTEKENVIVERRPGKVLIKTLNTDFYNQAKEAIQKISNNNSYIKMVNFNLPKQNNVSTIEVVLKDENVEVFNFFRERDRKHVFDFWREDDDKLVPVKEKIAKTNDKAQSKTKSLPKLLKRPSKVEDKTASAAVEVPKKIERNPMYRDFRYGASFLWNYEGFGPALPKTFEMASKTPEYFFPLKNREYQKNDKEAHLQLALNFYRKKKYGLMYKSIKLFQEKYGADDSLDFIEYMKANAILRDNIADGNREPLKMAINMLTSVAGRSKNYDLQKAVYKYLLQYYQINKEHVEGLSIAKRFYVSSKENFDYEESQYAAEAILYNLAELNQIEKVKEVLKEKTIQKIIPKSRLMAYQIYVAHRLGDMDEVLRTFESSVNGMAKPILPSVLYNVAEAYFRGAQYEKSIKLFDEFLTEYSFHGKASHSRLRIAIAYDLLDKDINQTMVLYKNAINRSQDKDISSEARIRFAGIKSIRKKSLKNEDKEYRAFLDFDDNITLDRNHKKLLWQVRLRSFIVDGEYEKALTYLSALPLTSLKAVEKRVFQADGAEVIYGIIQQGYFNSEFSKVVKDWNKYKEKYVTKVANDPYLNFIVGKSYLKLGLYKGFDGLYGDFKKIANSPVRTFPIWVERDHQAPGDEMLIELELVKNIKLKNFDLAAKNIQSLRNTNNRNNKVNYYQGLIHYSQNKYKDAAMSFEQFLAGQKSKTIFDPMELSSMINKYADSLYELGLFDKFQKVTRAILDDTNNYAPTNPFIKSLRERLEYLNVEIEASKGTNASYLRIESLIQGFMKRYPITDYKGRMNYLLGMAFAKNKKLQAARKVFEEVLKDEGTPASIKELVKSELSLMAIKERTI